MVDQIARLGLAGKFIVTDVAIICRTAMSTPTTKTMSGEGECKKRSKSQKYAAIRNRKEIQRDAWWAHKGSNLGPLPCEGNALPLSYAPGILCKIKAATIGARSAMHLVSARDLRSAGYRCQA